MPVSPKPVRSKLAQSAYVIRSGQVIITFDLGLHKNNYLVNYITSKNVSHIYNIHDIHFFNVYISNYHHCLWMSNELVSFPILPKQIRTKLGRKFFIFFGRV